MGVLGCRNYHFRAKSLNLLNEQACVRPGDQCMDAIFFRMPSDYVQSADTYGPGGPEEGERLQSPYYSVKRFEKPRIRPAVCCV